MRILQFVFIFFIVIVMLQSCTVIPVQVGDVKEVKLRGMKGNKMNVEVVVPLTNPNNFSFKLKKMRVAVVYQGDTLGYISDINKIKIVSNSTSNQSFIIELEFPDLLSGGLQLLKIYSTKMMKVTLTGEIIVKSGLVRKKIKVNQDINLNLNK